MRYMIIVKANADSEADVMPSTPRSSTPWAGSTTS